MDEHLDLIGKKLSGSLNKTETEAFEKLIDDAGFRMMFKKYEKIWAGSRESHTVMNAQSALNKVLSKIQEDGQGHVISKNISSKQTDWNWGLKIAASLLIIFSISFAMYWYLSSTNIESEDSPAVVQITKENPRGQKSTIFLPDGSKVVLNSESNIIYPSAFSETSREVMLDGEAFFEVEPNKNLPFIVKTGAVDVRVLGTSFNVSAYKNNKMHKVSLATGEVVVTQKNSELDINEKIVLSPGQAIQYDMGGGAFGEILNFNPKAEYGWKNGLIYFDKASFNEVINTLESWYGVDFNIEGNPNSEWHYSGEFDNYTLNNVLYALSFTGKFSYEIEGKKVSVNF